jgi:hypothetical protein
MTRRTELTIVSAALVLLAASQTASAQTRYDFKVPGAFVASGKTFPAGNYALSVNVAGDLVTVEPKDVKVGSVLLAVECRLSERESLADPEVVFDKLNGQFMLSELLVPHEDGYLLLATKAKHTHESLKGARGKQ